MMFRIQISVAFWGRLNLSHNDTIMLAVGLQFISKSDMFQILKPSAIRTHKVAVIIIVYQDVIAILIMDT